MNEHIQFIKETYEWALRNRIVKNQRDFADKVGISRSTMSVFISGHHKEEMSGKNTAIKVKAWMDKNFGGERNRNVEDYRKGYADALRDQESFDWIAYEKEATLRIFCTLVNGGARAMKDGVVVRDHSVLIDIAIEDTKELITKLRNGNE